MFANRFIYLEFNSRTKTTEQENRADSTEKRNEEDEEYIRWNDNSAKYPIHT